MLTGTSILPKEVMAYWLHLHNAKGGRLGGQSRFEDHLDDMPTAGWGYGALVNNQTQDFLELMYGHAANYQSRGTFHSTEQLSFKGTGRYRGFLHIKDPAPGSPGRFFPSFLSKMHEKGGIFCIFLLKIAEKERKTDQEGTAAAPRLVVVQRHLVAGRRLEELSADATIIFVNQPADVSERAGDQTEAGGVDSGAA